MKSELTRRHVLRAGSAVGVLGAAGAVGLPSPAWSWSPSGSIVGDGVGADPRWEWDPEADAVVAAVLDRGQAPRVNELLRSWTRNDQPLPAGLPADLRRFITKARKLPAWVDHGKLATAYGVHEKHGIYLAMLNSLGSGLLACVIPHEIRAVYYSRGGADMRDRVAKTTKAGVDFTMRDAWNPNGSGMVSAVKTRMVHAAVRHLLPQSPHWRRTADQTVPISQRDMMITWHSVATFAWQRLTAWNVKFTKAEAAALLHSQQVQAHMLGIRDEYIPATWGDAIAQSRLVLDPVYASTPEGIEIADELLHMLSDGDDGLVSYPVFAAGTRFLLGDKLTDSLEIPRDWFWDSMFRAAWPAYVTAREMDLPLTGTVNAILTQILVGSVSALADDEPVNLDIPTVNRPGLD